MKKLLLIAWSLCLGPCVFAQSVSSKLKNAYQQFESDCQLKHAVSSLYVIDAKTGAVIFDKNSQVGLAPASTQKIITSVTAFELLGKEYQYKTELGYHGQFKNSSLNATVLILGSGDPTFGSWRWEKTKMERILKDFAESFKKKGIKSILGSFAYETGKWESNEIPDGWIWQDIGNYYGAGASVLNWHENQYDLFLKSGKKIGDTVKAIGTYPKMKGFNLYSEARSAPKGTGDNAYIYHSFVFPHQAIVRGTIPVDEQRFK